MCSNADESSSNVVEDISAPPVELVTSSDLGLATTENEEFTSIHNPDDQETTSISLQKIEDDSREKSPEPDSAIVFAWPARADQDYECISSCGSGSFAQVYKARKRSNGQLVAVKVMACDKWALQEAAILRALDHDNICKLYDSFLCELDGVACLVMQYASGGDLLERMVRTGPLTEKAAAEIARQMLLALQYMHSKGVVHRDLKPENILYSSQVDGKPLLADFGVGKLLFDEDNGKDERKALEHTDYGISCRTHTTFIGTIGYSAPELTSEHGHSFAADVWSFGAVMYVLLCGYHPFDMGEDSKEVIQDRVQRGEILPMEGKEGKGWEHVSDDAKDFVRRCLVVSVDERATVEQCLAHSWLLRESQDVVQLSDAFVRLKVYQSSRRECRNLLRQMSVTRLKRKREGSTTSDDSAGSSCSTPVPCKVKKKGKAKNKGSSQLPTTIETVVCDGETECVEAVARAGEGSEREPGFKSIISCLGALLNDGQSNAEGQDIGADVSTEAIAEVSTVEESDDGSGVDAAGNSSIAESDEGTCSACSGDHNIGNSGRTDRYAIEAPGSAKVSPPSFVQLESNKITVGQAKRDRKRPVSKVSSPLRSDETSAHLHSDSSVVVRLKQKGLEKRERHAEEDNHVKCMPFADERPNSEARPWIRGGRSRESDANSQSGDCDEGSCDDGSTEGALSLQKSDCQGPDDKLSHPHRRTLSGALNSSKKNCLSVTTNGISEDGDEGPDSQGNFDSCARRERKRPVPMGVAARSDRSEKHELQPRNVDVALPGKRERSDAVGQRSHRQQKSHVAKNPGRHISAAESAGVDAGDSSDSGRSHDGSKTDGTPPSRADAGMRGEAAGAGGGESKKRDEGSKALQLRVSVLSLETQRIACDQGEASSLEVCLKQALACNEAESGGDSGDLGCSQNQAAKAPPGVQHSPADRGEGAPNGGDGGRGASGGDESDSDSEAEGESETQKRRREPSVDEPPVRPPMHKSHH